MSSWVLLGVVTHSKRKGKNKETREVVNKTENKKPQRMKQGETRGRRGKKRISTGRMKGIFAVAMTVRLVMPVLMIIAGAG